MTEQFDPEEGQRLLALSAIRVNDAAAQIAEFLDSNGSATNKEISIFCDSVEITDELRQKAINKLDRTMDIITQRVIASGEHVWDLKVATRKAWRHRRDRWPELFG